METKTYNIKDLLYEHRLWKSEIKIIIGELNVYQEWLSCISQKSHELEFQKKIDYFQNKLDIQKKYFDTFNDRVNAQDSILESLEKEELNIPETTTNRHEKLHTDILEAKQILADLKIEFHQFCKADFLATTA
jgi:hypothetical protein